MLSPRALSDRRDRGLTATAAVADSEEPGRDDLLLVRRISDMLGPSSSKLLTNNTDLFERSCFNKSVLSVLRRLAT